MCSWFLKNPDIWAWGFRFVQRVSCSPISARVCELYSICFSWGSDWRWLIVAKTLQDTCSMYEIVSRYRHSDHFLRICASPQSSRASHLKQIHQGQLGWLDFFLALWARTQLYTYITKSPLVDGHVHIISGCWLRLSAFPQKTQLFFS